MYNTFSRQPRFLPEMPTGEIEVPNPPGAYEKPEISWFSILAPPAVMLVITILMAATAPQSMFLMISIATTVMALLVSLVNAATQIRKYNQKKKEREKKYLQFIADTKSTLVIAKEQQTQAMNEMNPEPAECVQRIMKTDNRLWERTPVHNDFLSLRVGVGSAPLALKIKYSRQAVIMESDPLLMEPQRIATEFERIPDVPASINLIKSQICGIAGDYEKTIDLARLIALQVITHHGYDDVRMVLLTTEKSLKQWNWLRFVPHMWADGFSERFILCGKAMAHQTLSDIYAVLKERELKASSGSGSVLPHFVFIVEEATLLENEPIAKYIYNESARFGVSSIFIAQNTAYLPMNCQTVINLQAKAGEIADRVTGEKLVFVPDRSDLKNLELAARKLAALRIVNASADFTLPASVTLMDVLKAKRLADVDLLAKWNKNKTYKGMSVPIGVKAGGTLFNLDMHETGCGPHGLVAGTTGSGKSELLQSIIISLAANYHPHDIVFVLIDYKGGGMADIFQGMPHLVGTITNLGGNQTTRALLSIKSELMRRQRLFSEYGVNNIDKYQKLYYSGKTDSSMPAIPHLIMIADEFAELKQDQPDFMKELVSTARVGRSLGVHLILATQKPAGVVDDQIWSNSKFKICLKVQDERDSQDVIKRPDAAMIKEPGRAYIQVGNDEIFELFQGAYSGADYDPDGQMQKSENKAKRLYQLTLNGRAERIYPFEEEKIAKQELPSQLKSMVEHIIETAKQNQIEALEGPWLPPLPEKVCFDAFFDTKGKTQKRNELLSAPVGIMDDPRGQRQEPLNINFGAEGNLFVYGTPGTGKTTLLKTLCLSLAHCYTPAEVNLYIMDFGGGSFKSFEDLPHCGGVMTLEQESIINQFIAYIHRCIEDRKKTFETARCESFVDYRTQGNQMPAIVLMIDNYFALSETYDLLDDKMIQLAREGSRYGIYIVATATNAAFVRYKLSVNFKMAITFQLVEKGEYDGIVGRTEGLEPANVTGRGLVRGKPPLEFQAVWPGFDGCEGDELVALFRQNEKLKATPIPIMPSRIDFKEINKIDGKLAIGLSDNDLQPVYLDFQATPVLMVAGEAMSGKSTMMTSWLMRRDDAQIYLADSGSMGLFKLAGQPNVTDLSQVGDEFVDELKALLDDRRRQLSDCRLKGGDINTVLRSWKQIIFAIDRLNEFTSGDQYALRELLERVIKQERGLKVAIIAGDNTSELAGNWDSLAKAIREEQTGVLIGSIKEQGLYSAKIPYGHPEKNIEPGDGYLVVKNKYLGLRFAVSDEVGI